MVEPENVHIIEAYHLVSDCVHQGFTGMGSPIWTDIRTVLELHDLWDQDIHTGLNTLFSRIRGIIHREKDEQ